MGRPTVSFLLCLILALAVSAMAACSTPPEEVDAPLPMPTLSREPTLPLVAGEPGELLWRHEIGGPVWSAPTVVDGVVYFGSEDQHVYALDATTGSVLWRFLTEHEVYYSPTVHDGVVYVASSWGYAKGNSPVYALDAATGELLWLYRVSGFVGSSPTVGEGLVFVGSSDGHIYALMPIPAK